MAFVGRRLLLYPALQNALLLSSSPLVVQKLHPVLQSRAAAVGDVLLLRPLGPGRLHAQLVKSDSEVRTGSLGGMFGIDRLSSCVGRGCTWATATVPGF